jgi:NDP-mannose synthase
MRAVILAGGKGTRLMPYTTVLPKPLIPLGGRPVLELILGQLAQAGFTEVDLSVGHLGQLIRTYFTESATLADELELRYIWEDEPLGTAGALRQVIQDPDEPFLVMNGDIVTDLDYAALMDHHLEHRPALTIASFQKEVQLALGVLKCDGDDSQVLTGFEEKPTLRYEVSMGIYVYDPVALDHIPAGHFDFPDLVLDLVAAGEEVRTYPFSGKWFDIGTQDEYQRATIEYEGNSAQFFPPPTG